MRLDGSGQTLLVRLAMRLDEPWFVMRLVAILFLGRITRRSVHTEPTNQCPAQIFDLAS